MKQRREVAFVPDEAGEDFSSEVKFVLDMNGDRQMIVIHIGEATQTVDLRRSGNRTGLEAVKNLIGAALGLAEARSAAIPEFLSKDKTDPDMQPRSYEKGQSFLSNPVTHLRNKDES